MSITENSIDREMMKSIKGCANDAVNILEQNLSSLKPVDVVEALDLFIYNWQKGSRPEISEEDDLSLTLGSLWGEQLVKELDWTWGTVTFHDYDDAKAVGVFSPDRSLAIYPFDFIPECLENGVPVTIMLSFNMLIDGTKIPSLPTGGYENVMNNVHHIVPRG